MTWCRPAYSAASRNISRPAPSNTATGTGNSLKIATSPPLARRSNQSLKWIIKGADFTKLDADAHVGRRAIALFWTLNPDLFEGVSLTTLANRLRLHKAILSAQAAEARRKLGIKNRGQAHGCNFGKAEPKPP